MSDRIRLDGADAVAPPDPPPKPPPAPPREPISPPPAREATPESPAEPPLSREAAVTAESEETGLEAEKTEDTADAARKESDRTERRVKDAIRRRYEAERDRDLARQQFEALQSQLRAQQPPQPGQPPAEAVAEARRQIEFERAQRDFNEACNRTAAAGRTEFGDSAFNDAIGALNAVGAGQRADFLDAVTQIPDGHRLYPLLAADMDNAARILALPPMRMAVELAKLAATAPGAAAEPDGSAAPEPPPVTRAPTPIRPIRGNTARTVNPANESMSEFIKRRDREESERRRI